MPPQDLTPYKEGLASTQQDMAITELVVGVLESKRDEAIQDRSETESRWLTDLQQYEGNTLDRMTKGDIEHGKGTQKSVPSVHLTRARTNAIGARIINMLVPSNERSWDIEPTPVPDLAAQLEDQTPVTNDNGSPIMTTAPLPAPAAAQPGQNPAVNPDEQATDETGEPQPRPMTQGDIARQVMDEADRRSNRMREHMDDQVVEGRFNAEQRKLIMDGCKIGTGVMEGPVVTGSFRTVHEELDDGTWVSRTIEDPSPKFQCIDPWNFYPLGSENIETADGAFIDRLTSRRELQEYALKPGFDAELIRELLRETPHHSEKYTNALISRANISGETIKTDKRYSVWKYVGSLNREDLETLGVEVDEEIDLVDPIVEAWFCQGRLLKIKRHVMEGSHRLPFYVWNYEENEASIFGYGVPYIMRDSDRVIQATWRMILHNAAMAAGVQIVRDQTAIEPVDGDENITGGTKQWYKTDPEKSITDAFATFAIAPQIEALAVVHDRARQNADEELAFPLVAQGEPTEAVPTHSGLALLMNASNVFQRRIAQNYDDNILTPAIGALYEWNMAYNKDPGAKGDMQIRAYGATRLVVKDLQAQHLLLIADSTMNDRFAPLMDDKELLKSILKAAEVDPDTLMLSDEELSNRGPSQQEMLDMQEQQARIDKLVAETEQLAAGEADDGSYELKQADLMYRYDKLEVDLMIAQMKLEATAAEAAKRNEVSMRQIWTTMKIAEAQEETKRAINQLRERREQAAQGYKLRLDAEEVQMKKRNLSRGFDTYG